MTYDWKNMLPDDVRSADHILVSMSGGKDSVATWLYLSRECGLRVRCVFADTGWEWPGLDSYLTYLEALGCDLVRLPPRRVRDMWKGEPSAERVAILERAGIGLDDPLTFQTLAAVKGRFPSTMVRFCTTELKLIPLRDYRQSLDGTVVMASGVRAEESPRRANMEPWGRDDFMDCWRWLPIHGWTVAEVFDCHQRHGVEPNPLYRMGQTRVGCWPCIHARKDDLRAMLQFAPEREDEVVEAERVVRACSGRGCSSLFAADKAARSYRTVIWQGHRFARFDAVGKWVRGEPSPWADDELPWAEELETDGEDLEAPACSSPYGLCE